jgi:hypothetical protein
MRIFKTIILVVMILLAEGCKVRSSVKSETKFEQSQVSESKLKEEQNRAIKDSSVTKTKTTEKDTAIKIPSSSVEIKIGGVKSLKESLGQYSKQFKQAGLTITFIGDSMVVKCNCDSMTVNAKNRETITDNFRSISDVSLKNTSRDQSTSNTKESVEESSIEKAIPFIPRFIKALASIGGLVILSLIIYLIIKFKKRRNENII